MCGGKKRRHVCHERSEGSPGAAWTGLQLRQSEVEWWLDVKPSSVFPCKRLEAVGCSTRDTLVVKTTPTETKTLSRLRSFKFETRLRYKGFETKLTHGLYIKAKQKKNWSPFFFLNQSLTSSEARYHGKMFLNILLLHQLYWTILRSVTNRALNSSLWNSLLLSCYYYVIS